MNLHSIEGGRIKEREGKAAKGRQLKRELVEKNLCSSFSMTIQNSSFLSARALHEIGLKSRKIDNRKLS